MKCKLCAEDGHDREATITLFNGPTLYAQNPDGTFSPTQDAEWPIIHCENGHQYRENVDFSEYKFAKAFP